MEEKSLMGNRKFHLIALSMLFAVYIIGYIIPLGLRDMMRPDEFRYGEIPREMIANSDWTTPLLVGIRYFEKPALGYQWTALSMKLFGENAFSVRLPSALSVGLTALFIYLLCARGNRNRYLPLLSTSFYMSFALVFGVGTFAVLDSQLTMAITWCIGCYYLACESEKWKSKLGFMILAGLAAGAAFLFKGFLSFAVPVVVIAPYLIWQRQWLKFLTTPWLPIIFAVLVALPWSIAIWKAEPGFWDYFFFEEHIQRFTASTYDRDPEPFWFFIPILLGGMLPGGFYFLAAWRGIGKEFLQDSLNRFCICWTLMPFILFSLSSCKTGTYILPCFPPLAILIASGLLNALPKYSEKFYLICRIIITTLSWLLIAGSIIGGCLWIVWRIWFVEKLTCLDPMDLKPFLAIMGGGVFGFFCYFCRKVEFKRQIVMILGAFVILCGWSAGALLSNATNPKKMPEDTLKKLYAELEVTAEDIIAVDRGAATATAWILKREDLVIIGRYGEFKYGIENYPDEYKKRYYPRDLDGIRQLLDDAGSRRVFYVNLRDVDENPFPDEWQEKKWVRRIIARRGVTIVELAE